MKRTRRVEVVRYSRRIIEIEGDIDQVEVAADRQASDPGQDVLEHFAPAPGQDGLGPKDIVANHKLRALRERSLTRLGTLLRLRR